MQALLYYLALPFIYLASLLPFPVLYLVSDFVYFTLFYLIGYRKAVVYQNLKNSFPEKSDEELKALRKKFYHYLCDLFLEISKTLTISKSKMLKRCVMSPETKALFDKYQNENRHVIIVMGHFGNWEWAGNTFSLTCKNQLYVIYHPLKNKYFNKLIIGMRMRFGTKLIAMRDTMRDMIKFRSGPPSVTAFIADQTPHPDRAYWTQFLNQDTPIFTGTEKFSKKFNYPVIYVSVKRVRRGYYRIDSELLFDQPKDCAEHEISERHIKRLEEDILGIPESWLWSHRRWKHKRPAANASNPEVK